MFGVVPKSLWKKMNPPDDNNMCTWALRCLLIQTEHRNILIDTGMGDKQDEKFKSHFYPHGDTHLLGSIGNLGLSPEDITDVFLTHLHFDHCGGAVQRDSRGELIPTFPKAVYWSNKLHWDWAFKPNDRERASFLRENFVPLLKHGMVKWIDSEGLHPDWPFELKVSFCNGHTEGLMILDFDFNGQNFIYPTDLIPSSYHISLPFIMAYDVRPLETLKEKSRILESALERNSIFVFEHDPIHPFASIHKNDFGKIQIAAYPKSI
ncbi:MAG: MBL fold metallo-hydrolase [Saprospiraceae bacterium]|nr:MBL fold metallo-hydrolase [Saprospiraceae bacterium]